MASRGLCIIPEGRITKSCKKKGFIYEVSSIAYLDEILSYSKRNGLGVLYLSYANGIVYADDIVEASVIPIYKYTQANWRKWSSIIAEEIFRHCSKYNVSKVYIMCRTQGSLSLLISFLKSKGIEVICPILNCTDTVIRAKLSL